MKMEKDKKIEEILNSLDTIKRAEAPDFFYTRLKARMEKETEVAVKKHWVLRPVYTFAALILLLVVNTFILLKNEGVKQTETNIDPMQSIAAEYNLNDNSLYDIAQDK